MIIKKTISVAFVLLSLVVNVSYADGLTKQQGDAILQELQKIRLLLEKKAGSKTLPATAKVSTKGALVIGNSKAPITLVEYTDYQCPYCYKFYRDTYPQLKKKYIDTGKMRLIIKDLPLSFHPHASKAAQAARCASDQGKFLEMYDVLHRNSQKLDEKYLPQYAKEIALDINVFNQCLGSQRHMADIKKEMSDAGRAGISGTPTFILGKTERDFVAGRRIVGAKSMVDFERYIQELVRSLIAANK